MNNHLKTLLQEGKVALGAQLRLGVPSIAELFAAAGFDYLILDGEHAPQTPAGFQMQMQAMNGYACTPIVRLGRNDPDEIRLYLDMGAGGVLIPLIRTAADAEKTVAACYYPPKGTRGYGPSRAHLYGLDKDYYTRGASVVVLFVLETKEAVENIDAILAVEGVDGVIMGPADLSIDLGVPLEMGHPKVAAATDVVIAVAKRAGKAAGIIYDQNNLPLMRKGIEQGARILLAAGDEWMLQAAAQGVMASAAGLRGT
jgi:2-keto-3-deoxy-L-rhamnonate aldolase RhmA